MNNVRIATLACALAGVGAASAEVSVSAGEQLFGHYCAVCHGHDAKGNGSAAETLDTKPADLTGIAVRRNGVWPMLEVMSIIDGYTRQFDARADMPVIPEITGGEMIDFDTGNGVLTPVPARLLAIVDYLETLQSPRPERYVP